MQVFGKEVFTDWYALLQEIRETNEHLEEFFASGVITGWLAEEFCKEYTERKYIVKLNVNDSTTAN